MLLFNRKAYTLSQFILLWILGILFVILVCLNVMRYYATAQARKTETVMQTVRAEQEDRCAVGRKYAVYANHLKAFNKRDNKDNIKSVRYDLSSGSGMTAHHKFFDFRLQMPSYADGRICCDNCEKLNRYYISCAVLKKRRDFVAADSECVFYTPGKNGKKTEAKTSAAQSQAVALKEPVEKKMTPLDEKAPVAADSSLQSVPSSAQLAGEDVANQSSKQQNSSLSQPAVPSQGESEPGKTKNVSSVSGVRKCKIPAQGEFFVDGCSAYQSDARGSVIHSWNADLCAYDVTQSCVIPARWKSTGTTKEEKGLYPSDLEDYCTQLLQTSPCTASAVAGQECGAVNSVCYKDCKIISQNEVKETSLIVLYDVKVEIKQLRCMPAKEVTVPVP